MQKEYIEREAALEILEKSLTFCKTELDIGDYRDGCMAATQDDIGNIRCAPTADVVPRAEVEGIFAEIEKIFGDAINGSAFYGMQYAELKKKHIKN